MASKIFATLARLDSAGRFVENTLLVLLLGGMMILSVTHIVMREVFNTGVVWSGELLKLMVLWLAMIATVAACRDDRHIRIDALSHVLPDNLIRFSRAFVDLFAAVVCSAVAWHAWRYLQLEIEFEDTVLIDTPAWIAHMIIPLAFAITAYRFVIGAIKKAAGLDEPKAAGPAL